MTTFWSSWELWEQMTFVLALAIAATFCLGFIKVAWMNRYVRKHQIVDEEKRAKIRELRRSGLFIEPRKSQDVPFGVRAIQSGIQVDGIWISGTNTPVPASPKLGRTASGSPGSSPRQSTGESSQQAKRQKSRQSDAGGFSFDRAMGRHLPSEPSTPQTPSGHHPSYKPKRSSHLRFGSYGDTKHDKDTLAQLVGKTGTSQSKSEAYGLLPQQKKEAESSANAIDNDPPSSDSDVSFHEAQERQPGNHPIRISSIQSSPKFVIPSPHQAPLKAHFSQRDYAAIPKEDSEYERLSTSLALEHNAMAVPSSTREFRTSLSGNRRPSTEVPLLSQAHTPPGQRGSFVPGELHVNRASRRVNSGFEVLPAGTFGPRSEFKGGPERHQDEVMAERRQPNKLQKKARTSFSMGRPSLSQDRP